MPSRAEGKGLMAYHPRATLQSAGLILALSALLSLGCSRDQGDANPAVPRAPYNSADLYVTTGEDYELPAWADRTPHTGYVDYPRQDDSSVDDGQRGLVLTWAQLEPARGQYDWHLLDTALARAGAEGYSVQLYILGNVRSASSASRSIVVPSAVPEWLFTEGVLTEADCVNIGGPFAMRVAPSWRADLNAMFNQLVLQLGERGYAADPRLGSVYIHGISGTLGEEFWLDGLQISLLAAQAGFTAQAMSDWIESRFQAFATAFADHEDKVAWVGIVGSWAYVDPAYGNVARRFIQDAWQIGFGTRCGGVENYHALITEPAFGCSVDPDGYLLVDDSIPPIASSRYFGEENEAYGDSWTSLFGSRSGDAQRYRFSMLMAMHERVRWLWTSGPAEEINPPLSQYARFEFGKTVYDSPDAWAYLSETPAVTFFSRPGVVRNFERWLVQRDVPGAVTVPVDRVYRQFNSGCQEERAATYYDDTARRTDSASGNAHIDFGLDDRFAIQGPIWFKVEIRDNSRAAWHIEYANSRGGLGSTDAFGGRGDGQIKTVTFRIADADNRNGLDNGMDFRIACDGPGDVTVRWVRLVRESQP
jgi:hypothetical protein